MPGMTDASVIPPAMSFEQPGAPAEAYGESLGEEPKSLSGHFSSSAAQNPSSIAVISIHQVGVNDRPLTWSYAHLYSEAQKLAAAWELYGLRKGSVVIVLLPNCLEYALSMWAAAQMRAIFVPLDTRITSEFEGMCEAVERLRPEGVVAWDRAIADSFTRTRRMEQLKVSIYVQESHDRERNTKISKSLQYMLDVGNTAELERLDENEPVEDAADETALVVFTSGTTGRPKACPHTGISLSAATYTYARWRALDQRRSSLLALLPNSTVLSCVLHITWWRAGGTIVYPSPSFDAEATLSTLETGCCTDMSVVPSIFSALTLHPSFAPHRIKNLDVIGSGSTLIPPSFMNVARDQFSVKHATLAFGMSEGMSLLGWHLDEEVLHDGNFVSVGKAGYGVGIKICAPGSREPLNRGAIGELHASGPNIICAYLDSHSESFYVASNGRRWMMTGDQARMNMSGSVFITGRYKDIIIRGGKNISPALVEACLNKISAMHAQIVGIPDDLAGGVPVAVIAPKTREEIPTVGVLQNKVRLECGVDYVPVRVVSLHDLNLEAFPMTRSGKVKKTELRQVVLDYLNQNAHAASIEEDGGSTLRVLTSILARLLGQDQTDIPVSTPINHFADSITLIRLRYEVKRRLDKHIPDELLVHNGGLQTLANNLDNGRPDTGLVHQKETAQTQGPPSADDMIHVGGSLDKFRATRCAIELALEQFGLSYETDVQSVYPVPDLSHKHLTRTRDYHYNLRSAMLVTQAQIPQVREAIEATLVDWAIFRCIAVDYSEDQRLFVEIRCGEPLQKLGLLQDSHQSVANLGELKKLARSGLTSMHAHMPGPLFRAILVDIQDRGNNVGLIIIANHAVFDALSMAAWREDLERLLRNPSDKPSRVPYQSFANIHYNYRTSASAAKSVAYFADKLQGVHKLSKALWPPQTAPEWYIGNDTGWKHPNGTPGHPTERQHPNPPTGLDGIKHSIHLPDLPHLYPRAKISPATLLKAALALLTTSQTNQDVALMGTVQAARHWPFLDPILTPNLPHPLSIAGSTHTNVPHTIQIDRGETVLALLQRLSRDQDSLTAHAHAPSALLDHALSPDDRAVVRAMKRRQTFNWIVDASSSSSSSSSSATNTTTTTTTTTDDDDSAEKRNHDDDHKPTLHTLQTDRHFNFGILWNCRLQDPHTVTVHALFDDVQVRAQEMEGWVRRLGAVARWMHWVGKNWGCEVGEALALAVGDGDGEGEGIIHT
ncbi:MAG: hypothetical protein Q9182_006999 [Xanthomendoza sp. 2 TL-2023]